MPNFLDQPTFDALQSIIADLEQATINLKNSLSDEANPQAFVDQLLSLDEQVSRARLLMPLCTTRVMLNDNGRVLSLSDLLMESRAAFDTLARAQIEVLVETAERESANNPNVDF